MAMCAKNGSTEVARSGTNAHARCPQACPSLLSAITSSHQPQHLQHLRHAQQRAVSGAAGSRTLHARSRGTSLGAELALTQLEPLCACLYVLAYATGTTSNSVVSAQPGPLPMKPLAPLQARAPTSQVPPPQSPATTPTKASTPTAAAQSSSKTATDRVGSTVSTQSITHTANALDLLESFSMGRGTSNGGATSALPDAGTPTSAAPAQRGPKSAGATGPPRQPAAGPASEGGRSGASAQSAGSGRSGRSGGAPLASSTSVAGAGGRRHKTAPRKATIR